MSNTIYVLLLRKCFNKIYCTNFNKVKIESRPQTNIRQMVKPGGETLTFLEKEVLYGSNPYIFGNESYSGKKILWPEKALSVRVRPGARFNYIKNQVKHIGGDAIQLICGWGV